MVGGIHVWVSYYSIYRCTLDCLGFNLCSSDYGCAVDDSAADCALPDVPNGQPGVGVRGAPSGNGISRVDLGPLETVAPTPVNAQLISTTAFPTRVDIHSPGTVDDPNGTGIAFYLMLRNGAVLGSSPTPNYSDLSVSAGTTYSYSLAAFDYHLNPA